MVKPAAPTVFSFIEVLGVLVARCISPELGNVAIVVFNFVDYDTQNTQATVVDMVIPK